jgi:hypothetical protein
LGNSPSKSAGFRILWREVFIVAAEGSDEGVQAGVVVALNP